MDDKRASELISENLTAIYGFAFARLYDKDKVEDLASEIIYEILVSAKNLKKEEAFRRFARKIAENTFRKFIKRNELVKRAEQAYVDEFVGIYERSPHDEYIEREKENATLYLLRRELSLLSKTHREVCVAYYVDNKSCSEIAKEQNISVEMVKYHLFKTRKLLKEGIGMTRTLGEKSYNPGVFRLNFWGDYNHYGDLFKRKLPGSIMLSAYHAPLTAEELSVELGVSMPYLEDEIEILESAGLLKKNGNKYQTNLVIITDEYEKEFNRSTAHIYDPLSNELFEKTTALLPQIRELDFKGNDYNDNRLLFAILNIIMVIGYDKANRRSPKASPPKLPLGGHGHIFGHDNDYLNQHFRGICMQVWNKEETAWFSAENYSIIESCQVYEHSKFHLKVEAMCDAILEKTPDKNNETLPYLIENGFISSDGNKLSANFPVFDNATFKKLEKILSPLAEIVADCMITVSDLAEPILADHAPEAVRSQCKDIAKIRHRLDVTAFIIEKMIENKKLIIPNEKVPLCVWGVKSSRKLTIT